MRYFFIATLASLLIVRGAAAQSVDAYAPAPNGSPASLAIDADGKVVIVGNFNEVGTDTRHSVARLNTDGSVDATFGDAGANGEIQAVAVQPDGKLLIGGDFTTIGGQPRHSMARLNADGTLDATLRRSRVQRHDLGDRGAAGRPHSRRRYVHADRESRAELLRTP